MLPRAVEELLAQASSRSFLRQQRFKADERHAPSEQRTAARYRAARARDSENQPNEFLEQERAQGMRSPALLERLRSSEAQLETLKAVTSVIDVKAILAAIPVAVARYRQMVSDGKRAGRHRAGRKIIRNVADRIPVRPGADGGADRRAITQ